ncbi:hypothetical protein TL16_g06780 [Triparma laevis f. inornata]|uniref:TRAF3-interacting protein 1 n=1 Tax=Triparma laevis f. inornata TaxID=1714386 RepID=A0A9W7EE75_9STRA|nr:hypothetical protein TL16_g06780 [Triparma laevis f. inornata]
MAILKQIASNCCIKMEDAIVDVQNSLGVLFKKPKCSEKLLNKPPFRFLHDCVTATMNSVSTGFCQNLYSDFDLDSSNIKEKQAKIDFLNKIINLVGICLGEQLDIRSTKVVAGLEPLNTNIFLAHLGRVATDDSLDHADAVERTQANETPGDGRIPKKEEGPDVAEAKSPDRPSAAPAAQNKSLDEEPEPEQAKSPAPTDSAALFAEEAKKASDVPSTRSGTRSGKRNGEQTSDSGLGPDVGLGKSSPGKGASSAPNLDSEIDACNSDPGRTREMVEKVVQKPKCSDKLLNKPPFRFLHDLISAVIINTGFASDLYSEDQMDSKNVKEKPAKIDYLEKIIKHVGANLNTIVDARPAKIVAGLEAENTCRFLQLLALAAANQGGPSDNADTKGMDDRQTFNEPNDAKSPAPVAAPKHSSPAPAAAPSKSEPTARDPSPAKETTPTSTSDSQPKSMRPTTARRRPPKVKENTSAVSVQETVTVNKTAKKAAIMKEGEGDDDDFFKDDDDDDADGLGGEAKFVDANDLKGKNVSKLVQNIVAEQEEEKRQQDGEEKVDDGKKGIKLSLNLKKSSAAAVGGMSISDMENLTKAVQRLVMSTAPLGKCMDYVQEDLSQMQKEGAKWATLLDLEDQVEEIKEKIAGKKLNISKNDAKIKTLLRAVVSN